MTLQDRSSSPRARKEEDAAAAASDDKTSSPPSPTPAANADSDTSPASTATQETPATEIIEMETFLQIRDLDEEDNHEFSKGMAWAYFEQAATTFQDMDNAYAEQDLPRLSSLGHFLKGSSAALGVTKVQASCERIQHYGALRDEEVETDLSRATALEKIAVSLERVKKEYAEAEKWLKQYYSGLG